MHLPVSEMVQEMVTLALFLFFPLNQVFPWYSSIGLTSLLWTKQLVYVFSNYTSSTHALQVKTCKTRGFLYFFGFFILIVVGSPFHYYFHISPYPVFCNYREFCTAAKPTLILFHVGNTQAAIKHPFCHKFNLQ